MEYPKQYFNYEELIRPIEVISQEIINSGERMDRRENFFPELINRLNLKTGVEVGVDTGNFSYHLLSKSKIKMGLVDNWMDDFGSDYRPGFFDPIGENRMNEAKNRLQEFEDRTFFIKANSVQAADQFEDNSIDFCYIDGDHSLEMLFDVYTWINKVRVGGIIAFDDYKDGPNSGMKDYFGNQLPFKIKTCLDFFCDRYGFKLNTFGPRVPNAWFVKNR